MIVALIGTGVIGASWAAAFLARGMDVVATDPAPDAEAALRRSIEAHWPTMERVGLTDGATRDRLNFVSSLEAAVEGAAFVQENGPENLDMKRDLFRRMDAVAPADAILATSTSTIMVSQFQDACALHPERVVLGHPFNPPHLIPLVEVGGGAATAPESVARAMAFYRACGKRPIELRREVRGHIANRLQAALWREAFHLVSIGVASTADVDAAIAHGPGLRWALLGPFLNMYLSGGEGGLAALFERPLWREMEAVWQDLGAMTEASSTLRAQLVAEVAVELPASGAEAMVEDRDRILGTLLQLKAGAANLP